MSYIEKIVEAGETTEISRYYSIRTGKPEGMRRREYDVQRVSTDKSGYIPGVRI